MTRLEVLLPALSIVAIFLARILELGTKRNIVAGPIRENITLRLFILTGIIMLASTLTELFLTQPEINWWLFGGGWLVAIASFVIRRRAITALGRFWSLHVEIRDNHEFVRTGPFRWLRHPTYFSMILELLSVGIIAGVRFSFLTIPLLFIPVLLYRVRVEEHALIEKFGEEYREYQKVTPAILPYKLPRAEK
ncbi:MAG: isoprenylcysteine carboxylmethyltransferase family protein [Opitutaceae bacterium]|nr:isoprenylcysteine carboxylmethyltransferase family protein [Verrucomicrobiales bacterium]